MVKGWPSLPVSMRSNRDFMRRVGGYLARELGFRLDLVTLVDPGVTLVDPGVTLVHRWHPDDLTPRVRDNQVGMYGGLAVKP